jgi:hypothetical protein
MKLSKAFMALMLTTNCMAGPVAKLVEPSTIELIKSELVARRVNIPKNKERVVFDKLKEANLLPEGYEWRGSSLFLYNTEKLMQADRFDYAVPISFASGLHFLRYEFDLKSGESKVFFGRSPKSTQQVYPLETINQKVDFLKADLEACKASREKGYKDCSEKEQSRLFREHLNSVRDLNEIDSDIKRLEEKKIIKASQK